MTSPGSGGKYSRRGKAETEPIREFGGEAGAEDTQPPVRRGGRARGPESHVARVGGQYGATGDLSWGVVRGIGGNADSSTLEKPAEKQVVVERD